MLRKGRVTPHNQQPGNITSVHADLNQQTAAGTIRVRLLRLLPIMLYCSGIFFLSSLSKPPDAVSWIPDKIGHLILYTGLGWLAAREIQQNAVGSSKWIWIGSAIFCLLYGITDELHQYFVPGRSPEIGDLLADTAGGFVAGAAYVLWIAKRNIAVE
jgi:VanZ family protein